MLPRDRIGPSAPSLRHNQWHPAHRAGVVSEAERQLEYHDSAFEDLVANLRQIPTKVIAEATGL